MSNELPILNQISIPEPCPASWDAMTGDEKSRHCAQCEKSVFHLSNMTADEAARVVEQSGGDLCVRGAFRPDGSLVTRGTRPERAIRMFRRLAATAVALPMMAFLPGCSKENLPGPLAEWLGDESAVHSPVMGDVAVTGQMEMGAIALPEEEVNQPLVDELQGKIAVPPASTETPQEIE